MTRAKAIIVPVTPFQQNCTVLWCEASKRAAVIDPGGDLPNIERAIAQTGATVDKIWLTHGHIDHVGGAADLKASLNGARRRAAPRRSFPAAACGRGRPRLRHFDRKERHA